MSKTTTTVGSVSTLNTFEAWIASQKVHSTTRSREEVIKDALVASMEQGLPADPTLLHEYEMQGVPQFVMRSTGNFISPTPLAVGQRFRLSWIEEGDVTFQMRKVE